MDFTVLADYRVKIKESKKLEKYQDLARELKKLLNLNLTVIPIVVGLVWFGLLGFYGISTFVDYLTPNPFLCK